MRSFSRITLYASALTVVLAAPIRKREVPQEHSHNRIISTVNTSLKLNNPANIVDAVFGLLGASAAAGGAGSISDVTCLQQATADQAFTNAKAAGDVDGQVAALTYRALERNSGAVGLATDPCTSIKAVNPEIAAISQHQDAASPNAAAINKAIVLTLAQQIASVGGDPQLALKSGTFAPGQIGDPTARGNSCDDANDPVGCIFTQNLLVPDATADEINAAVGSSSSSDSAANTDADSNSTTDSAASTATASAADAAVTTAGAASSGDNLQTFTGALGGSVAPPVTVGGRGFVVATQSDSFLNLNAALGRSCDVQHNACANIANSNKNAGFNVGNCDDQNNQCHAAITSSSSSNQNADAAQAATTTSIAAVATPPPASSASSSGGNLQTFTGALGGITAPPVTAGGKGFVTNGSDFVNLAAALGRSCDVQHNGCADKANSGGGFSVGECDTQDSQCKDAAN